MRLASALVGLGLTSLGITIGCGGGVAQGDYVAYRIAGSEAKLSEDCFVDDPTSEHTSNFRSGSTVLIYNAPAGDEDEFYLDTGGLVLPGERNDDGSYEFTGTETDVDDVGGQQIRDSDHDGLNDNNGDDPLVDSDMDGLDDENPIDDMDVDVDMDGEDDRTQFLLDQNNDGIDDRDVFLPSDTKVTEKNSYTVAFFVDGEKATGDFVVSTDRSCSGSQCAQVDNVPFKCKATTEFVGVEIEPESAAIPVDGDDPAPNP